MERHGTGWWCSTCRRRSMVWHKLAPQSCHGRAPDRWVTKAADRVMPTTGGCKKHHVVESKPLLWCSACGAYGESAPKLLMQPCRGDPRGKIELMQMATQLRMIRRGEHPFTKARLGPPTALSQHNDGASSFSQQDGGRSEPKQQLCIDDDGTEFSEAFRRRGRPPVSEGDGTTIGKRIKGQGSHLPYPTEPQWHGDPFLPHPGRS